ncbi:MAG: hypothetical protein BWX70_03258 [Verrucomicrobia bacterium ADurb.Bin070]|nr:MAG: hypothetical protein BWX70_03258 [Verrucomicrobia bacterium ADurb.Bin070]
MSNVAKPMMTTWTWALPRASLCHWNVRCAKWIFTRLPNSRPQISGTCSPWVIELVDTKPTTMAVSWM